MALFDSNARAKISFFEGRHEVRDDATLPGTGSGFCLPGSNTNSSLSLPIRKRPRWLRYGCGLRGSGLWLAFSSFSVQNPAHRGPGGANPHYYCIFGKVTASSMNVTAVFASALPTNVAPLPVVMAEPAKMFPSNITPEFSVA